MSVSDPPTQSEVQTIADKLDELINALSAFARKLFAFARSATAASTMSLVPWQSPYSGRYSTRLANSPIVPA